MKKVSFFIGMLLFNSSLLLAQVGMNNDGSAPDASAGLDVSYTNKGVLIPRMTSEQIAAINSPADGLMVYNSSDKHFYYYTTPANTWVRIARENEGAWSCSSSFTVMHSAGNVAPVSKLITYGTVTNIPGETSKCWITQNLGAAHQATAVNDNTEESAGWYWQFNQMQGYKHDGTTRTPNTTWINSIDENSHWLTANDPCALLLGSGWRLPTYTEWNNVYASGGWTNWNDPWNSALKMMQPGTCPVAMVRSYTGGPTAAIGAVHRTVFPTACTCTSTVAIAPCLTPIRHSAFLPGVFESDDLIYLISS